MASLNGTFDATEVAPAVPLEVLPPGKYLAQLIESEMAPTKAGDGQLLKLVFEILEGPSTRRKIFDQLNLVNRNEQTVEIAQRTLSAICHAVGQMHVGDSERDDVKGAQGVGLTGVLLARGEGARPSGGTTIGNLNELLPLLSRLQ